MNTTAGRYLAAIVLITAIALPSQTAVSASVPDVPRQSALKSSAATKVNPESDNSAPTAYAERLHKLDAAIAVKKRDRKVVNYSTTLNATPRNARLSKSATPTENNRKRAVWYGTDCYYATSYQAADICWEDDAYDADQSLDAEIIWADTYVSWNEQATVYTDIVPAVQISDNNWLRDSDNALNVLYDTDDDGLPDVALVPSASAIKKNKTAGVYVVYYVESQDEWYFQAGTAGDDANCYATIRRFAKSNHWAFNVKMSWWQVSADWTCLFDYNAATIGWSVYLEDYWGSDFAPDEVMATMDYVDALNFPLVTEITPRRGYDRAGGEVATVYGENLYSVGTVMERYESLNFDYVSDGELEFETYGGVGCTDIDLFNDDWWIWYRNAICYQ